MIHSFHPLIHDGYRTESRNGWMTVTSPDGDMFHGRETDVLVRALNHVGIPCRMDPENGQAVMVDVAIDQAGTVAAFSGFATMQYPSRLVHGSHVRPIQRPEGIVWTMAKPAAGTMDLVWCLSGRFVEDVAKQRESGAPGDPAATVYACRYGRDGSVTHLRCGARIGEVTRTARGWSASGRWASSKASARQTIVMAHVPTCPQCRSRG